MVDRDIAEYRDMAQADAVDVRPLLFLDRLVAGDDGKIYLAVAFLDLLEVRAGAGFTQADGYIRILYPELMEELGKDNGAYQRRHRHIHR